MHLQKIFRKHFSEGSSNFVLLAKTPKASLRGLRGQPRCLGCQMYFSDNYQARNNQVGHSG